MRKNFLVRGLKGFLKCIITNVIPSRNILILYNFFPHFQPTLYTSKEYSRVTNCSHLRAPKTINFALQSFEAWQTIGTLDDPIQRVSNAIARSSSSAPPVALFKRCKDKQLKNYMFLLRKESTQSICPQFIGYLKRCL